MPTRYPLVYLLLLLTGQLSAQSAERLTDLGFGTRGGPHLTALDTAGGQLYGTAGFVLDGRSPLVRIDPTTGAATPLLTTDDLLPTGDDRNNLAPAVFGRLGLTLATVGNHATGYRLYRIAGDAATPLHTNRAEVFSNFVTFDGRVYFMSGDGDLQAELWRTDGTAPGTRRVAELPFPVSTELFRLVAGDSTLLLAARAGTSTVLYTYRPSRDELLPAGGTAAPLSTFSRRPEPARHPLAYFAGGFYVAGLTPTSGGVARIFRIDGDSGAVTSTVAPTSSTANQDFDRHGFLSVADSLFHYVQLNTGATEINAATVADPLRFAPVFRSPRVSTRAFFSNDFGPEIAGGDLYFVVPERDTSRLYTYRPGADTATVLASLPHLTSAYLSVTDSAIYLGDPLGGGSGERPRLLRYDRNDGGVVGLYGFAPLRTTGSERAGFNPQITLGNRLYFIGDPGLPTSDFGAGLYVWEPTAPTPRRLGDFAGPDGAYSARPPRPIRNNRIFLRAIAPYVYDENSGETTPLDTLTAALDGRVEIDAAAGEVVVVATDNETGASRFYLYRDNRLDPAPLYLDGEAVDSAYWILAVEALTDSLAVIDLRDPPGRSDIGDLRVLASFAADGSVRARRAFPADSDYRLAVSRRGVFGYAQRAAMDGGFDYAVLNLATGAVAYEFSSVRELEVVNYSATGAYARATIAGGGEELLYYPAATPENRVVLTPPAGVARPYAEEATALLGDRLLFRAYAPATGWEMYVADPASAAVDLLADLNPGPADGVVRTASVVAGGQLYFEANDGTHGAELHATDGTAAGTRRLLDLNPGTASAHVLSPTIVGDTLYFTARGGRGFELYRLPLGAETAELVVDLNPTGDGYPYGLFRRGNQLYFMGRDGSAATFELFRLAAGTVGVRQPRGGVATRVYPNPVGDGPVVLEVPPGERLLRMEVFTAGGRRVAARTPTGVPARLDLSALPAGLYWVHGHYASGQRSVHGVVKE